MHRFKFVAGLVFSLVSMIMSSGCLLSRPANKVADKNLLPQPTGSSYTVLVKGSKPETRVITEGMTVQGVLDATPARKRFGKMEIVVKRVIPGKATRHQLKVDYDAKKKRIPYDQDYTIYPNDIVLISPDNTTQLDKMMDAMSGVFGK